MMAALAKITPTVPIMNSAQSRAKKVRTQAL